MPVESEAVSQSELDVDSLSDTDLLRVMSLTGQQHLLRFWNELSSNAQGDLRRQVLEVDWALMDRLVKTCNSSTQTNRMMHQASPPTRVVRTPRSSREHAQREAARTCGIDVLRGGKVAVLVVAGGQGTRLGFPQPKGMFPIGPVSGKSLFQLLAEKVVATRDRYQATISYLVMTSDTTHEATVAWFDENAYFGLDPADVHFFQQGGLPVMDSLTGKCLLADRGQVCMSADGHGGVLSAMQRAGLFDHLRLRGVEYLFYHQVDNPLVRVCDPVFLGYHVIDDAEVSTKVIAKRDACEKVGVVVEIAGQMQIIEYSDLPVDLSQARNEDGSLTYWAGNTGIHVFNRSFLEYLASNGGELPWHAARKKTPFVDDRGQLVQPAHENGLKFERFIFDALPLADRALIVETDRAEEFAPLKNREGESSPADVQRCMNDLAITWLRTIGVEVPSEVPVEISPLVALEAHDLPTTVCDELRFAGPVYLSSNETLKSPHGAVRATVRIVPR